MTFAPGCRACPSLPPPAERLGESGGDRVAGRGLQKGPLYRPHRWRRGSLSACGFGLRQVRRSRGRGHLTAAGVSRLPARPASELGARSGRCGAAPGPPLRNRPLSSFQGPNAGNPHAICDQREPWAPAAAGPPVPPSAGGYARNSGVRGCVGGMEATRGRAGEQNRREGEAGGDGGHGTRTGPRGALLPGRGRSGLGAAAAPARRPLLPLGAACPRPRPPPSAPSGPRARTGPNRTDRLTLGGAARLRRVSAGAGAAAAGRLGR